jgi:CheY-like chemotaxis protein
MNSPEPTTVDVLLVDDNPDALTSMAILLSTRGLDVIKARCGEEALDFLRFTRPRAIMVDLAMPGMDGLALARRIRALPELAAALLIAVTGAVEREAEARAAGFDEFLRKPVTLAQLESVLPARRD